MKRYKISWRMSLDVTLKAEEYAQFMDLMVKEGQSGDEFWIFISEPTSNGYEPLEEVARKCELYKAPAAAAKKRGIRVGINPWPTFGSEEGWQSAREQHPLPFQPVVDHTGKEARRVACPISPEFLEYSYQRYKLFAQTGCDFVWVDDDCRFTHLGDMSYPCFCPRCVRGFEGGRFPSREALVDALNEPGNAALRRAWSAYGAKRLALYCAAVRKAVDDVDPAIQTPFMSVGYSHTSFSGDYIRQCMKALRSEAARPGHGFYSDDAPMGLFDKIYEVSRQVPDIIPEALNDVQYEEESCPMTPMNKAFGTRLMEMALSVWGGCTGVAMNHLLHVGGPTPFGYLRREADALKAARPFLDRYLTFADGLKQSGIWAAYSAWAACGAPVDEKGWFNETDPDLYASRFVREWPCFGHPVTADRMGAYATLLQGRLPEVFSGEELEGILSRPVIMDGMALESLWRRGFGERTGVRVKNHRCGGTEILAATEYAGPFAGAGRSTLFAEAYDLEPLSPDVETLAYVRRPYGVKAKSAPRDTAILSCSASILITIRARQAASA